jgi:type-2 restriction enzyme ecoRII
MINDAVSRAIEKTMAGQRTFCKLLSPNDSGETGGHQSGFLISKSAKDMLFSEADLQNHIAKKDVCIKWQDDFYTEACFTWYASKNELRITRFTRGFPFKGPDFTGALFILIKNTDEDYAGFVFNTEDEIDEFLNTFGLTPAETNRPIELSNLNASLREKEAINKFIEGLTVDFPSSEVMSSAARMICCDAFLSQTVTLTNPDKALLDWTGEEYKLFKALEHARYGDAIAKGFASVDEFVSMANQVLNRRKSRAGKSLEHHLSAIFDENAISYTAQAITEGNKRPDFIFPSEAAYHDFGFPVHKLTSLAAKTTCKDRWRQILNEADRLRDGKKYLCTLQQGISAMQLDEMEAEGVTLVVPKPYISTYPREKQSGIWTLSAFVNYVKELERS